MLPGPLTCTLRNVIPRNQFRETVAVIQGSSSAPATIPTASRNPATMASGTTARPRSSWSTSACSRPQHDQLWLSGIDS